MKKLFLGLTIAPLFLDFVSAHCPLCTAGAAAAAGGAVWLGVSKIVVALFIGAFAMSMGLWFSNIVKKRYIKLQKTLIVLIVFLSTVLPLIPIFSITQPLFISLWGNYGSLFNRTYLINLSLLSNVFGGLIVFASPHISNSITKLRKGKMLPFQGVVITLLILIVIGVVIQLVI